MSERVWPFGGFFVSEFEMSERERGFIERDEMGTQVDLDRLEFTEMPLVFEFKDEGKSCFDWRKDFVRLPTFSFAFQQYSSLMIRFSALGVGLDFTYGPKVINIIRVLSFSYSI